MGCFFFAILFLLSGLLTGRPTALAQTPAAAQPSATGNCAAATVLAQGIALNIADQRNEQTALSQVSQVLKATPVDQAQFQVAKASLLAFVNNGIAIREMNQKIAPQGSKASNGLQMVAMAQQAELNLTQNLVGDPKKDNSLVSMLDSDFAGGIRQNMQNMADATAGCPNASPTGN